MLSILIVCLVSGLKWLKVARWKLFFILVPQCDLIPCLSLIGTQSSSCSGVRNFVFNVQHFSSHLRPLGKVESLKLPSQSVALVQLLLPLLPFFSGWRPELDYGFCFAKIIHDLPAKETFGPPECRGSLG